MEEDGVGEKKEKRILWPNCPLQGRHGDWVGVRRMGLREMRKHNIQPAVCDLVQNKFYFWIPLLFLILTALKGT